MKMPTKKATTAEKNAPSAEAKSPVAKASAAAKKVADNKNTGAEAKDTAKKAAAGETKSGKKVNPALMKPLQPSKDLAAIVGTDPLPRSQVIAKVWEYVKKHELQNPKNKREIIADKKLQPVFGGKDKVSMFEMSKHIAQHLT